MADKPKLLFLVTEDWYFCSHRIPIAKAAKSSGYEVAVATRVDDHGERIRKEGFNLIPVRLRRSQLRPLRELLALWELIRLYRRERPDLVHHVALKPVIYGTIAARLTSVPLVISALAGLGYVFTTKGARAGLLRKVVRFLFGKLLGGRGSHVIVQNPDDKRLLEESGIAEESISIIRGSGVDPDAFSPTPEPNSAPVVSFVGRMLWDKGIAELVESARTLKKRWPTLRVWLVGPGDPDNPSRIDDQILTTWHEEGVVEWIRFTDDVAAVWAKSHVAVLPSYREGLPKSLLEAAACGRPMVATDVPGCREIVVDGENGYLVPVRNPTALAESIEQLLKDAELRRRMGENARHRVLQLFSEDRVVAETLKLYRSLTTQICQA